VAPKPLFDPCNDTKLDKISYLSGSDPVLTRFNDERLALAKSWGAETCNAASGDPIKAAQAWTEGVGVDGVIIWESAKNHKRPL